MKRYKQTEIDSLANILKQDGVISVPTDTVYGVCARIQSQKAFEKLVEIKNRPANKSFPVMCLNENQIKSIAIVNTNAEKIIRSFMPGPITIVLKKKKEAFSYINNAGERESDELAVRIAPLKVLEKLIEKTFPKLDAILEGEVSFGEASTIVDCTTDEIKIQRQGPISLEDIMKKIK